MSSITTRAAKGSELTHEELDNNFTNLNNDKAEVSSLANVATSGSYTDLSDKPTIPSYDSSNVAITGGNINGVNIGSVTAGTGRFSSVTTTGGGISVGSGGITVTDGDITLTGSGRTLGLGAGTTLDLSGTIGTPGAPTNITQAGNITVGKSGYVRNITVYSAGNVTTSGTGGFYGNVMTASQPNITSVGTLGSLSVTGNVTAANFSGNLDYSYITNAPTIPTSIFDLSVTDGTNGQVLTTDGNGTVSFTTVSGGGSPGGSDTQIQYNSSGSFAGLSTVTTDGANITLGNVSCITSENRFDRTDQVWNSGSSGSIGTIHFGNETDYTSSDPFSLTRNSKVLVQNKTVRDGSTSYSSVRRSALSAVNTLANTQGNISLASNDRQYGINASVFYDGGSGSNYQVTGGTYNAFVGGAYNCFAQNGLIANGNGVTGSSFVLNAGEISRSSCVKGSYGILGSGTLANVANFVVGVDNIGTVTTGTVVNSYGFYMGTPSGTSDTIFGINGSLNPAYQTGTAYFLYNNNQNAISKLGSLATYDEVYNDGETHTSDGTYAVDLSSYNNHEITLSADITELTFTGYNTSTTPKPRRIVSSLTFIQDSTGGYTVTWPAGTKFANGVTAIDAAADSVTDVGVEIRGGVYYVHITTYA